MAIKNFDLSKPLPDIFPKSWKSQENQQDFMDFRNLDHFRYEVSKITQKQDNKCGVTYADALKSLMCGDTDLTEEAQSSIRNLVRKNLHKRGLLTQEVYENYRYDVEGTAVGYDVGKYAAGEPDCVVVPTRQYIDFFYELYISISYSYMVPDETVRSNVAKLLAAIEELERRHIYIKITLVMASDKTAFNPTRNYFSTIPLFSHKEPKSVKTMSSVVNEKLLRKFYFALMETTYGKDVCGGLGVPVNLEGVMNIGEHFNEIDFYQNVVDEVGAGDI